MPSLIKGIVLMMHNNISTSKIKEIKKITKKIEFLET